MEECLTDGWTLMKDPEWVLKSSISRGVDRLLRVIQTFNLFHLFLDSAISSLGSVPNAKMKYSKFYRQASDSENVRVDCFIVRVNVVAHLNR